MDRFHAPLQKKRKNRSPASRKRTVFPLFRFLFLFEAIATSAAFRIATARIAYVDFAKRTIIARAIVLTFGDAATDTSVDFLCIFVHHSKKPPLKVQAVYANLSKIIDISENLR